MTGPESAAADYQADSSLSVSAHPEIALPPHLHASLPIFERLYFLSSKSRHWWKMVALWPHGVSSFGISGFVITRQPI